MSSRFIPPNVGSSAFLRSAQIFGIIFIYLNIKTSMSANILNNTPFPSITGLLAAGPILPIPARPFRYWSLLRDFLWLYIYKRHLGLLLFLYKALPRPVNRLMTGHVCFRFFGRHHFNLSRSALGMIFKCLLLTKFFCHNTFYCDRIPFIRYIGVQVTKLGLVRTEQLQGNTYQQPVWEEIRKPE